MNTKIFEETAHEIIRILKATATKFEELAEKHEKAKAAQEERHEAA